MRDIFTHSQRWCLLIAVVCFSGLIVSAQNKTDKQYKTKEFCSENWSNDDKVTFREVREMTVRSTGLLDVNAGRNGGISVKGEDRSDILVRACVRTWGDTEAAAKALAATIRIVGDSTIRTEGASNEHGWSVSYQISVPRAINLKLETFNGGISVKGVEGTIQFKATNGGVSLHEVAGDVTGRTTNGGISVLLAGNSWKGNGLDVGTTNGGVSLMIPENFAARVEVSTVNGGFRSDIDALKVEKDDNYRTRGVNISKDINGGGALVRVATTNGGVSIGTSAKY